MPRLTFSGRIFLCIFVVSTLLVSAVAIVLYRYTSAFATERYVSFYNSVADNLMLELQQLEQKTNLRMDATALALKERLRARELPTHEEMSAWSGELGLDLLYYIDDTGRFIRSAADDLHLTPNAFTFCKDYKGIFERREKFTPTGVVLSVPTKLPFKFTFVTDPFHNGLIELGIHLDYIGKSLQHIQTSDDQVESISLEAPNGEILAEYRREGSRKPPDLFQRIALAVAPSLARNLVVTRVVPAVEKYCCSCVRRGLVLAGEDYRYILKLGITRESLRETFGRITFLAATICLIAIFLGAVFAKGLAARLVRGLNQIGATVAAVIRTGDLNARLHIKQRDEIGDLADGLNRMIAGLSERKKIELELDRQATIAQTAQNIAHDLKNPIATIERAAAATTWGEFERQRSEAQTALLRLQTMIEGFKRADIELIVRPEPSLIDLAALAKEAAAAPAAQGVKITTDGEGVSCRANVDKPKLDRAVTNLITNAIEAGATHVLVDARLQDGDLVISVIDDGPGVPQEIERDLFRRGATYGKIGGLGIGLDYVATVARGHGGTIEYRRDGPRTIFRIALKGAAFQPPGDAASKPRQKPAEAERCRANMVLVHLADKERQADLRKALSTESAVRQITDPAAVTPETLVYTDDGSLMELCVLSGIPVLLANPKDPIDKVARQLIKRLRAATHGKE